MQTNFKQLFQLMVKRGNLNYVNQDSQSEILLIQWGGKCLSTFILKFN